MALLPSPRTSDTNGVGHHGDGGMDLRTAVAEIPLLPTPAVNDMGAAYTPETWDEWTATMKAKHNNGNGHGKSLNVEAQRLLPTPTTRDTKGDNQRQDETCLTGALLPIPRATDGTKGGPNQRGSSGDLMLPSAVSQLLPTPRALDATGVRGVTDNRSDESNARAGESLTDAAFKMLPTPTATEAQRLLPTPTTEPLTGNGHARHLGAEVQPDRWGEYGPAIRRWESVTRPAPEPTKPNAKGNPKLSDEFDEWLMGYPAGWITDVPGVTWNEALKACGNGVVPQQGAAALRWLLTMAVAA